MQLVDYHLGGSFTVLLQIAVKCVTLIPASVSNSPFSFPREGMALCKVTQLQEFINHNHETNASF